jgi:hypothetical protein
VIFRRKLAPERRRQTTWKTFVQSHWDVLGAIDFTMIAVWTKGGLVTFDLLFARQASERVQRAFRVLAGQMRFSGLSRCP